METNYAANSSNVNRNNPDFGYTPVQDAVVATITELVEVICATPQHPERRDFLSTSAPIPSGGSVPQVDFLGNKIMGGYGAVLDSVNEVELEPASLDIIRDYNIHKTGIYTGIDFYWFAYNGQRILHTRPFIVIDVEIYERIAFTFGASIPLRDSHEKAIVNGAVAYIGQKEGNYSQLVSDCKKDYDAWCGEIRNFAKFPVAQIDPSQT